MVDDGAVAQRHDDTPAKERVVGLGGEHRLVDYHYPVEHGARLHRLLQLVMRFAEQAQIARREAHHVRIALHYNRQSGDKSIRLEMQPTGTRIVLGPKECIALGTDRICAKISGFRADNRASPEQRARFLCLGKRHIDCIVVVQTDRRLSRRSHPAPGLPLR